MDSSLIFPPIESEMMKYDFIHGDCHYGNFAVKDRNFILIDWGCGREKEEKKEGEADYTWIDDKGNQLSGIAAATAYTNGGGTVYVGYNYDFRYVFSEQVLKAENEPLSRSRLQIRNMTVLFNDTGFFEVVMTPKNRTAVTTQFTGRILGSSSNVLNQVAIETGDFKFNVLGKASDVS